NNNKTSLDLALDNGRLDVAGSLAEWMGIVISQDRINPASLNTASQDSLPNALHAASEAGHLEIVQSLLEVGADVNERDEYHWTPLFLASNEGRVEVAKLLIEYGA